MSWHHGHWPDGTPFFHEAKTRTPIVTEKLQGIPVEFLALTEGTRDEDGRAVVVLSVRGLNPDNPRQPSNISSRLLMPNDLLKT